MRRDMSDYTAIIAEYEEAMLQREQAFKLLVESISETTFYVVVVPSDIELEAIPFQVRSFPKTGTLGRAHSRYHRQEPVFKPPSYTGRLNGPERPPMNLHQGPSK